MEIIDIIKKGLQVWTPLPIVVAILMVSVVLFTILDSEITKWNTAI